VRYIVYDAETRSTRSLKHYGSHIYTCDPSTDVWCVSYCLVTGGIRGPISTWLPTDPVPAEILAAAADPETLIVAFNDAFERQVEQRILGPRYGWPIFPLERRRCAQAVALSHALPASLDAVAAALKLLVRKTPEGKRAMKALAAPRKSRQEEDPSQIYWHDTPERLATLYEYNRLDVEITAEIIATLGLIPPNEQSIWQLDAAINERGICCDVSLLDAALNVAEEASADLAGKLAALTDGEITTPGQTQRILRWLARHGCALPDVQKATLIEALKRQDLAPPVKQLLTLRLDGAHAAVDKLITLRRWTGDDQRVRHCYRYHGAMPGRFTSVGAQMQNLKKPGTEDVGGAIDAVRNGSLAYMRQYERPLEIVGDITRGLITAAPGHRLFIADLSGIESRGLAWLCNEQGKLDEWREFDRTGDPQREPYYRFGVEELRLDTNIARKIGKTCDLAFGYQGGVGVWRRLAPPEDSTPDQKVHRKNPSCCCGAGQEQNAEKAKSCSFLEKLALASRGSPPCSWKTLPARCTRVCALSVRRSTATARSIPSSTSWNVQPASCMTTVRNKNSTSSTACWRRPRPPGRTRRCLPNCCRCRTTDAIPRSISPHSSAGRERLKRLASSWRRWRGKIRC